MNKEKRIRKNEEFQAIIAKNILVPIVVLSSIMILRNKIMLELAYPYQKNWAKPYKETKSNDSLE